MDSVINGITDNLPVQNEINVLNKQAAAIFNEVDKLLNDVENVTTQNIEDLKAFITQLETLQYLAILLQGLGNGVNESLNSIQRDGNTDDSDEEGAWVQGGFLQDANSVEYKLLPLLSEMGAIRTFLTNELNLDTSSQAAFEADLNSLIDSAAKQLSVINDESTTANNVTVTSSNFSDLVDTIDAISDAVQTLA